MSDNGKWVLRAEGGGGGGTHMQSIGHQRDAGMLSAQKFLMTVYITLMLLQQI